MEQVKLNSFAEAPYNPRNMTEDGLERLCASIKAHSESLEGWSPEDGLRLVEPIILNRFNNRLVGGHMRCRALQKMGQDWVSADDIRYVTITDERKEAALNVVLNNPKVKGEWDYPKLKEVIAEIDHGDFNLEQTTGFLKDELDLMFGYVPPNLDGGENQEPPLPNTGMKGGAENKGDYLVVQFDNLDQMAKVKELFGLSDEQRTVNFADIQAKWQTGVE